MSMTRPVFILGCSGQVGSALHRAMRASTPVIAPSSTELSLVNLDALRDAILSARPSVIVNAAALTAVDLAEAEPELARVVNGVAPGVLAAVSAEIGARFVHVSTDYVFDGTGSPPFGIEAPARALNVYGATKLEAERAIMRANPDAVVIRTSWVHSGMGTNFVGTAVRTLSRGQSMRVVDDQIGVPTRVDTLVEAVGRVLARPALIGVLHMTDAGVASWYDVACAVLETLQNESRLEPAVRVEPVNTDAFPRPAVRPRVSILDCHSTRRSLDFVPPHWRVGVATSTKEWLARIR
jgi:dTDP-4-dehydrorhamnose reductase